VPANAATSTRYISLPITVSTEVVPDTLIAYFSTSYFALENDKALANLATGSKNLINALKAKKVSTKDIKTSSVNLYPEYTYPDNSEPVLKGYRASQSFTVTLKDIAKSGEILSHTVSSDPNTRLDGTSLLVLDSSLYEDKLRADAIKKAKKSALAYTKAAGVRLGKLHSIVESSNNYFQPYPVERAAVSDSAPKDVIEIQPGTNKISLTLTVKFLII
jgi:uncharacterized protein YggE